MFLDIYHSLLCLLFHQIKFSMESVYQTLAARARDIHQSFNHGGQQQRVVVALAGPPGSGKSTIAEDIVQRLNLSASKRYAAVLPMDGFHLPLKTLDALSNREDTYARRGAAWTFNAQAVIKLVKRLQMSKHDKSMVILAPTFDHATKDPVEDSITITPETSLLILEGNWLLFDETPWRDISALVEDTWFVDVEPDLAFQRVAKRHLRSGIEDNWDDAARRTRNNDLVNGELVRTKLVRPAVIVRSVDWL